MTFPGPVAAHAGFLLLVTAPLCWRFRAPATVAIVVTAATAAYVLVMFSAKAQPPIEPWLAMVVSVFALASRADGRRLRVAASIAGGLFLAGEIRAELAGQGTGNVLPAVLFYALFFVLGRMVHAPAACLRPARPCRKAGTRAGCRPRTARCNRAQLERHRGSGRSRAAGARAGP
jgi:hypothetical protein